MNQRSRNSRRHATMLDHQLVKRSNGRSIAQHHRDLPSTRNAGGLALGACLGRHLMHRGRREDFATVSGQHRACLCLADVERSAVLGDIAPARRSLFDSASDDRGGKAGRVEFGTSVHGLLHSGPIPPMGESYAVTSDVSTGICI